MKERERELRGRENITDRNASYTYYVIVMCMQIRDIGALKTQLRAYIFCNLSGFSETHFARQLSRLSMIT